MPEAAMNSPELVTHITQQLAQLEKLSRQVVDLRSKAPSAYEDVLSEEVDVLGTVLMGDDVAVTGTHVRIEQLQGMSARKPMTVQMLLATPRQGPQTWMALFNGIEFANRPIGEFNPKTSKRDGSKEHWAMPAALLEQLPSWAIMAFSEAVKESIARHTKVLQLSNEEAFQKAGAPEITARRNVLGDVPEDLPGASTTGVPQIDEREAQRRFDEVMARIRGGGAKKPGNP